VLTSRGKKTSAAAKRQKRLATKETARSREGKGAFKNDQTELNATSQDAKKAAKSIRSQPDQPREVLA